MRRPARATALLTLALLAACTPSPSPAPADNPSGSSSPRPSASTTPAVQAPTQQFAALPGDDTGANDWIAGMAVGRKRVVAVGGYEGWRSAGTFRFSDDGGRTWKPGSLSTTASAQTQVNAGEIADAVVAPGSAKHWLALTFDSPAVAWTSLDGITWDRHPIASGQVKDTDGLSQLITTSTGYLAVGSRNAGATDLPMAWTSSDGLTWKAHRMPGSGSPAGVAIRGRTAVAVGSSDDGDDNRTWRSTDGGVTWRAGGKPPRVQGDDDFNRSLGGVVVRGRQFLAIGQAWTDEYEPTLYTSSDGRSWRIEAKAASFLDLSGDDFGEQLVGSGSVAVTQKNGEFDVDRLWYRDGSRYRAARTPLTGVDTKSIWSVQQVVQTPRGWLASVSEYPNGRTRGHLWFSTNGRSYEEIEFPATDTKIGTVVPGSLVMAGGHAVVTGISRGLPAWWSATGQPPYRANTLADQFGLSVDGADADGKNVLIWGTVLSGNSKIATVWAGKADGSFLRAPTGTFGKAEDYGYSYINQIRRIDGTWIAVGERSHNGSANQSALISTSADGRHWRNGTADTIFIAKDKTPEGYAVTDLAGSGDHVRTANDIVAGARGPIAVGSSAEKGESVATLWRAVRRDGRVRWQLQRLPVSGYEESDMTWAQTNGSTIVVMGSVRKKGVSQYLPYVWRSVDGGVSFSGSLLPLTGLDPAHTGVNQLLRTSSNFVLIGRTGEGITQPIAWRTRDGKTWTRFALNLPRATLATDVFAVEVTADGPDLVQLVRTTNRAGSGVTLIRQRVG